MKIGFIGLGSQGGGMAEMIKREGHELRVWARRPEVLTPYLAMGAKAACSPAELAASVDILCLCVVSDDDVREVVFDKSVLKSMTPGSILVIHSTVNPQTCIDIAKIAGPLGISVLDAPVSGSGEAALEKRLLVMVGGDKEVIERARPVFASYGNPIYCLGSLGSGQKAKLVNNLLCIANMELGQAALKFSEDLGMAREETRQMLLAGSGQSFALNSIDRLVTPDSAAHVSMLFSKDINLAMDMAQQDGINVNSLESMSIRTLQWLKRLEQQSNNKN